MLKECALYTEVFTAREVSFVGRLTGSSVSVCFVEQ